MLQFFHDRKPATGKTHGREIGAKDIAVRLGVSEDSVCYWENGRVYPLPASVTKIMPFLNDAKLPSMEK